MKLGVTMSPTAYSIRPDDLAVACEERGFESLWFPEHSHIPTSRRSPVPTGGELPKEYAHTHDLFIALTLAAAATKTIKLGSGICLAVQRDPIMLAKEVASFDQLSNGRFLFGIGGGWNAEEMENHGVPFHQRWKVLREKIEAMKVISNQLLSHVETSARDQGVEEIVKIMETGPVARTIVGCAKQNDVDLIVIGSRGMGNIEATLRGGVSHRVEMLAKCSVLTVK